MNATEVENSSVRLARQAKEAKPDIRYAGTVDDTSVVAWVEDEHRWVRVAGKTIMGDWQTMAYELLVNGERLPLPALVEV
jgi:hypothetical protein